MLPLVCDCILSHGFQCLTINTKLKVDNSRSCDSFANVLKEKICMHCIFVVHAGSIGHQKLVNHA